jgi:hypothetical protein
LKTETEHKFYYQAARFSESQDSLSKQVWTAANELIETHNGPLSLSRFTVEADPRGIYVAVYGELPTIELDHALSHVLEQGEKASLPDDTLESLIVRRSDGLAAQRDTTSEHAGKRPVIRSREIKFSRKPRR